MLYIIYCALNELISYLLFVILQIEASYLYYLFSLFEFCFFAWYFYLVIHNSKIKQLLSFITAAFVIFVLIDYFFLRNKTSFNSISSGIETVLIIAMCIYYFFDQLKQPKAFLIYSSINFWIIIAFLVYLSGTFFLYIYAESMLTDPSFRKLYIIINSSFTILKAILLCVAMLMKPENDNNPSSFPNDNFNGNWRINKSLHN